MKQLLLIFLTHFFITNSVYSQKHVYRIERDTIQVYADKVLMDYRKYMDSKLTGQGRAFYYSTTAKFRISRLLPRFIKSTYIVDSVVLHGKTKDWLDDKYRIGEYENGHKNKMTYFNDKGVEISQQEFYSGWRIEYDPEKGTGIYTIIGKKQKSQNR